MSAADPRAEHPADPCTCNAPCPHGVLCSGGHSTYPDRHWWPCCDKGCRGEMNRIHRLALGGYIIVLAGCGHALAGDELGPLTRQGAAHMRECRDRDEQLRAAGRRQAAREIRALAFEEIKRGTPGREASLRYSALRRAARVAEGAAPPDDAAEARGYARAIAALRDEERYRNWWTSTDVQPVGTVRQHLADYLEEINRPLPTTGERTATS